MSSPTYASIVAIINHINSTPRSLKQGSIAADSSSTYRTASLQRTIVQAPREEAECDFCTHSDVTDYTVEPSLAENELFPVQITPFNPTYTPHEVL